MCCRHLLPIVVLWSCLLFQSQAQSLYFPPPGNDWETIDPITDLNWCPDQLDTLKTFLDEKDTKAFIILKGGRIAVEWYFDGFTQDSLWYWASAGKSLTATLVGIARQEGFLDLDDPTTDYLGNGWTSCSMTDEEKITIRHQLTMTSGLDDKAGNADCTDPTCLECLVDPGTRWAYHNAPYTLLDQVIAGATGTSINSFYNTYLGSKIGAGGLYLKVDFNNVFFSRPRDMARFGLLIQGKGTWDGVPVLSDTAYYQQMVNTSQDLNKSYGYLWWLNGKGQHMIPGLQLKFNQDIIPTAPDDLIAALGKNDQKVYVVPSQDLVVIRMGNSAGLVLPALSSFDSPLWERIGQLPCTTSTLPPSTSDGGMFLVPNPAAGSFQIAGYEEGSSWQLFSLLGMEVSSGTLDMLQLSGLASGTYLLQVRSESGKTTMLRLQVW